MINIRTPVINAIGRQGRSLTVIFDNVMRDALKEIREDDPCSGRKSTEECRQIGDMVVYHMSMELFQIWFEWHHRPVDNMQDAEVAIKEEDGDELG